MDTDLSAWTDAPKISAADVAEQTVQALAHDPSEVLADKKTRQAKAVLSQPLAPLKRPPALSSRAHRLRQLVTVCLAARRPSSLQASAARLGPPQGTWVHTPCASYTVDRRRQEVTA
ncbi:Rossmann-fold NAD(P)-binding domain-containing protein [Streptomyces hirsutus]|uniref:hypothetical protein n=1 Tax=Streptomyces hirsutus TaxID=35620 RepID=UPI00368E9DE7